MPGLKQSNLHTNWVLNLEEMSELRVPKSVRSLEEVTMTPKAMKGGEMDK